MIIRTLFLLSALVAAALAVLFDNTVLYIAAGVLALVFVVILVGVRRRRPAPSRLPTTRTAAPANELEDLGILEVRPRGTPSTRPAPPVEEGALPEVSIPDEPAPTAPTRSVVRVKTAPPRQDPDVVTPDQEARATLNHLLHALLHATGAQTTGLLREEMTTSRRYHLELIVSRNAFARAEGSFVARTPFATAEQRSPVLHVIGGELTPASLRYYREELAIHRLLAVALTYRGTPHVLFADAMEDDLLATPSAQFMLEATARIIEQVHEPASTEVPPLPVLPAATSEPPATTAPASDEPRPRREIIAEEMDRDRQMALMLVHQQADDEGDLDLHERALHVALESTFPDTRIERFGDLTFGVFLRGPVEAIEERVGVGHAQLTEQLPHPVSVGAVYVAERHDTPDALRADATDALQESYETGQPVLVG